MKPKEFITRYWPSVVPAAVLALITASLPVDWSPPARMGVALAALLIFNGGRAYQDQLQERRGRIRKLYEDLIPLARDFQRFLQTSSSRTRDVSVFQATMALYNENAQQLVVWYHGVEEARMALDWWHHFLVNRLQPLLHRPQALSCCRRAKPRKSSG